MIIIGFIKPIIVIVIVCIKSTQRRRVLLLSFKQLLLLLLFKQLLLLKSRDIVKHQQSVILKKRHALCKSLNFHEKCVVYSIGKLKSISVKRRNILNAYLWSQNFFNFSGELKIGSYGQYKQLFLAIFFCYVMEIFCTRAV